MKRTSALLASLLTLGAVLGVTACEPKQDLTLKLSRTKAPCLADVKLSGHVPAGAADRVTYQRTVNGKWVPYAVYMGGTEDSTGTFVDEDGYYEEWFLASPRAGTVHLRVIGNGHVSNSVYLTTYATSGHRCY